VVLFFVLNPKPILFIKQLQRYVDMEALIQIDFPALETINREIDALLPPDASQEEEFTKIQQYVYKHIRYVYDWDNWGNIDFWPTAEQVWDLKQEDCDGRAVLAASILRSRGFTSAKLVGNIRHIWVHMDQRELMGPDKEQNIWRENGRTRVSIPSFRVMLGSMAIYIADFPTIRNLVLFFVLILLCYHPCKSFTQFFGITTVGLVGFILLKDWAQAMLDHQIRGVDINFIIGSGLLCLAILYSLCIHRMIKRKMRPGKLCQVMEK